jgi:Polysaccharide lyase family 4, domain II
MTKSNHELMTERPNVQMTSGKLHSVIRALRHCLVIRHSSFVISLLLVPLMTCGCDRGSPAPAATTSSTGNGVIHGRVFFVGEPPPRRIIPGSPNCVDESVVVGPAGGLKNVIVFLADARPAPTLDTNPEVLDQINCVYVPHVLALHTGQTLRIKSSDALMHNVNLQCAVNPQTNFGFAAPGQKDVQFAASEPPFRVKCDVHPWMSAWIGVFDHPWFAVTGDDGSFTISHVPAGTYTLAAWHEALPRQEQRITISDTSPADVTFNFRP